MDPVLYSVSGTLTLYSNNVELSDSQRFPFEYKVSIMIVLTETGLNMEAGVYNFGETTMNFQFLFHNYFQISDIQEIEINGFSGEYFDANDNCTKTIVGSVKNIDESINSIFKAPINGIEIVDGLTTIKIESENMSKIVVWCPWKASLAKENADYHDDAYKECVCVEPGQVSEDTERVSDSKKDNERII